MSIIEHPKQSFSPHYCNGRFWKYISRYQGRNNWIKTYQTAIPFDFSKSSVVRFVRPISAFRFKESMGSYDWFPLEKIRSFSYRYALKQEVYGKS